MSRMLLAVPPLIDSENLTQASKSDHRLEFLAKNLLHDLACEWPGCGIRLNSWQSLRQVFLSTSSDWQELMHNLASSPYSLR